MINRNIEQIMASRVLQSGSNLNLNDVKATGKEHLKTLHRTTRTKKKTRIEQKLKALENKANEL